MNTWNLKLQEALALANQAASDWNGSCSPMNEVAALLVELTSMDVDDQDVKSSKGPWIEALRTEDQVAVVPMKSDPKHPLICTVGVGSDRPYGEDNLKLILAAPGLAIENRRLLDRIKKLKIALKTIVDAGGIGPEDMFDNAKLLLKGE